MMTFLGHGRRQSVSRVSLWHPALPLVHPPRADSEGKCLGREVADAASLRRCSRLTRCPQPGRTARRREHDPHAVDQAYLVALAQELGSTIPPRAHVLGEVVIVLLVESARQPKVADDQVAVGVHEDVGRLEVPMENAGGVDVLDAPQELIQEVLVVLVGERLLRTQHPMQIRLHEVGHQVDVREVLFAGRVHHDVIQPSQGARTGLRHWDPPKTKSGCSLEVFTSRCSHGSAGVSAA
eukprot:scaffold340_cov256-Pinguiococcus_pyrenoidosus.AAC.20